jgi:putative nucleotidyltransferase with HDIG domain
MSAHAFTHSERLRASFAGRAQRMAYTERRSALVIGTGFLAAALALALLSSPRAGWSLPVAVLYLLGMAAASEIHVEIGHGFTVPTQVVFVPMMFAVPSSLAPLFVASAFALAMLPSVLAGRAPVTRLLTAPGNSWFALGPALVLTLTRDHNPDGRWGVLALALLAQFTCDFCSNAAWERLRDGLTIKEMALEMRQVYLFDLALAPLGLAVAIAADQRPWAVLLIVPLFGVLRWFSKERRVRMGEHCKDVVLLALAVARELGLDAEQQRLVEFGALLHDIGKIAVPKEIVNKPGKLDPDEWEIIKTHTVEGQRMLERVGGFMGNVGRVVRCHHERWDGSGYPDGLRAHEIPLAARIISCCDAFNAMTTNRPYRRAMPDSLALAELAAHAGTQFDPRVVDALTRVVSGSSRGPQNGAPALQSAV